MRAPDVLRLDANTVRLRMAVTHASCGREVASEAMHLQVCRAGETTPRAMCAPLEIDAEGAPVFVWDTALQALPAGLYLGTLWQDECLHGQVWLHWLPRARVWAAQAITLSGCASRACVDDAACSGRVLYVPPYDVPPELCGCSSPS